MEVLVLALGVSEEATVDTLPDIVLNIFSDLSGIVLSCSAENATPGLTNAASICSALKESHPIFSQKERASFTTTCESRDSSMPFIP